MIRTRPNGATDGGLRLEVALLAAVCYLPLALGQPGLLNADTKQYLYLDPGGLLARAAWVWDPSIAGGTVTHQNIGYLWPMGPYYWLADRAGLPDWLAQRLWLGSILFAAALGTLTLLRHVLPRHRVQVAAALAYGLSPVVLGHITGQSALLLPFAALPWMVWAMRRALEEGGWRWPAVIALLVTTAGSLNGSSVFFAIVGTGLVVPYAIWWERTVSLRHAATAAARTAVLTIGAQLWWMAAYVAGGAVGLPLLSTTETVGTTSLTTSAAEIARGLGYWFFYGGDSSRPWLDGLAPPYLTSPALLAVTFLVPVVALAAAGTTRWRDQGYVAGLTLTGLVIAAIAFPEPTRSPLGGWFEATSRHSDLLLSLRNTQRAGILVALGLALALGAALTALTRQRARLGLGAALLVTLLVATAVPALWRTGYVAERFHRSEDLPGYWLEAADHLSAGRGRVLEVPGIDFAAYRWGNTLDPVTPGLVDRSYVARELVPMGGKPGVSLLNAFDRAMQEGWFEPSSLAPVARLLGASDLVVRSDLEYERYRTARPEQVWSWVERAPGLGEPALFGPRRPNRAAPERPMIDEVDLDRDPTAEPPPPVAVFPVDDGGMPLLSAQPTGTATVLAGDGEGIVAAAAAGLVDGRGPLLWSADLSRQPATVAAGLGDGTRFVLTDSNRKRGERWYSLRENVGATEPPGATVADDNAGVTQLPVVADQLADAQTVARMTGVKSVRASQYGGPFNLIPEERPALAFDGDLRTAWRVDTDTFKGPFWLRVELTAPSRADHIVLHAPQGRPGTRTVERAEVVLDGTRRIPVSTGGADPVRVDLDGKPFSRLEVRILAVSPDDGPAGFAEVEIPGVTASEVVALPTDLFSLIDRPLQDTPFAVVLSRHRSNPSEPVRADPEPTIRRRVSLPEDVELALTGTVRLSGRATDSALDSLLGLPAPHSGWTQATSSERLPGSLHARASAALDGDLTTAWSTPLVGVTGQWWEVTLSSARPLPSLTLDVVADEHHSTPRRVSVSIDGGEPTSVELPDIPVSDELGGTRPVTVPLPASTTGRVVRITIDDVAARTSPDWYTGDPSLLPVALAEVHLPQVVARPAPDRLDTGCRDDLVALDGRPIAVRATGSTAGALDGQGLALEPCRPGQLSLTAGAHDVSTGLGRDLGLDVDRVVLRNAAWDEVPATDGTTSPRVSVTGRSRTTARADITTDGQPFWLTLDQSYNEGWELTTSGASVTGPHILDGRATGWLVEPDGPGTLSVVAKWTPQTMVWWALGLSVLTVLACLVLIARGTRTAPRRAAGRDTGALLVPAWPRLGLGHPASPAAVLVVGAALLAGLAVHPLAAPIIAAVGVALRWRPLNRWAVALPAALMAAAAALVLARQIVSPLELDSGWPGEFPWAHLAAALAIHVLGIVVHGSGRPEPPPAPPGA